MNTTQEHISISEISDSLVSLKNGNFALALRVGAVNFGLLSEQEQIAIISSFAQMLNSLSFAIQISIISKRLDISSYLKLLDQAQNIQPNKLLSQMMQNYRQFVESLIRERDVLDKTFYIVLPLSGFELGVKLSKEDAFKKAKTVLEPRRDQIIRQLARVGLKANQLQDKELIKLFYEIYNGPEQVAAQAAPIATPTPQSTPQNTYSQPPQLVPVSKVQQPTSQPQAPRQIIDRNTPVSESRSARNHPFVVEELI
jgi:hypothetical protein